MNIVPSSNSGSWSQPPPLQHTKLASTRRARGRRCADGSFAASPWAIAARLDTAAASGRWLYGGAGVAPQHAPFGRDTIGLAAIRWRERQGS